jgi:hypothetical protein
MVIGAIVCAAAVAAASPQSTTTSTETRQFEIIAVSGNDIVVNTAEGTRELTVPEDFRFTVDGRQVSVHELKAGMKGTATITTRTTMTPVTVTEVKNGTVAQVTPSSIVLRTDQGLKSFTQSEVDKRGVKILREGKPAQLADFRPGDYLSATIVTTMPPATMTERELQAAITSAAPAQAVAPVAPDIAPPPAAPVGTTGAAAQESARTLPKTAGPVPMLGLIGLTALAIGAALRARRRRSSR